MLAVVLLWMLAHNTVYTCFATCLRAGGLDLSIDVAFVLFGAAALVGIWITGALLDRALRVLVLGSIALFLAAGVVFAVGQGSVVTVVVAILMWGLAFGGAAAQLQTADGEATGENADVANALLGVSFNLAIFGAGLLGALLLQIGGGLVLPTTMVVLALAALAVAATARRDGFPAGR